MRCGDACVAHVALSRRGGRGVDEVWGRLRRPSRGTLNIPLLGRNVTNCPFPPYIVQRPFYGIHKHHPQRYRAKHDWGIVYSMHGSPEMLSSDLVISEASSSSIRLDRRTLPTIESKAHTPRFLITLDRGIGDTALVGLSALEQIIQNDPAAYGKIDILCTPLQSQIFKYDPRIDRVIQTDKNFSAGPHVKEWLRGIILDAEAAQIIHFLQSRRYEAVLPAIVAPGLYLRLHSHLMYPQVFKLAKNLLQQGSPSDIPMRKFI